MRPKPAAAWAGQRPPLDALRALHRAEQVLDGAELDFSRYGDTLFEVFFVGGRLATGGSVAAEGKRTTLNVRRGVPRLL